MCDVLPGIQVSAVTVEYSLYVHTARVVLLQL